MTSGTKPNRAPPGAGVDVDLGAALHRFQADAGGDESALSNISLAVRRGARFTNTATTPSGLTIVLDEPAEFGGTGTRPDPAEHLLAAVGASLSVTLTAHAALRGWAIHGVEILLSSDLDGRSFFAPKAWPRAGLLNSRIEICVTAPLNRRQARSLLAETLRASPVFRSLKRRPKVALKLLAVG
jgi:uncharacterized OsmC-like protein